MVNGQPRQPPLPKMQHVTVSRAHSFPKTSPLAASMDYQVKTGAVVRAPNVSMTPQHTRTPSGQCPTPTRSPAGQVGPPSRGASSAGPSRTHGTPSSSTQTSPAHVQQSRIQSTSCSNGAANSPSNGESRKAHHSHGSHGHSRTAGSTNSPRTSRKAERSKHSSSAEKINKHGSGATSSGHRSHSSGGDVPPHTPTRTPHSGVSSSTPTHSRVTPPNVIVGAVGGDPPPPPPMPREKVSFSPLPSRDSGQHVPGILWQVYKETLVKLSSNEEILGTI